MDLSSNNKNKKYDIDLLLKQALKTPDISHPELALTVGARIARPQADDENIPQNYTDKSRLSNNINMPKNIRRYMNTAAAVIITIGFIAGTVFAAWYLHSLTLYENVADVTEITHGQYQYNNNLTDASLFENNINNIAEEETEEFLNSTEKENGETTDFLEPVRTDNIFTKNYKKLLDINPDLYCWIKVSFTTIDYPVVQATDNEYYLNHSFEKKHSNSGAIFADYRNGKDISENRNLLIYGHNMLDNSMFQPLIDFSTREDYFTHGIIELITQEAIYYYEIFSVSEEDPKSGYIQTDFKDDEEYVEFLYEIKERSVFQKDIILDENSKIITLSTCINDVRLDMRFAVRGVLTDVVKY